MALIFVVHDHDNKERTRRLFTVLNKYAQKPKEAELIILDEDDAAAIITRRLLNTHEVLKMKNAISSSNSSNLPSNDFYSFTTLVMLNRINKLILARYKVDYTKRPKDNVLNEYYEVCSMFWDYFFNQFPQIQSFIQGESVMFENGDLYNRNNQTGGSLLLRPVGQKIFAQIYNAFNEKGQLEQLTAKIPYLDFNLNGPLCKYITWNNKILPKSESLQKRLLFYVLGLSPDESIHDDLKSTYENFGVHYNNRFEIIDAR